MKKKVKSMDKQTQKRKEYCEQDRTELAMDDEGCIREVKTYTKAGKIKAQMQLNRVKKLNELYNEMLSKDFQFDVI